MYQLPHNDGGYVEKMAETYLGKIAKKVDYKKRALIATADKEKSLRAECERMIKENYKLRYLQSQNVTIHREVKTKLDEDSGPK